MCCRALSWCQRSPGYRSGSSLIVPELAMGLILVELSDNRLHRPGERDHVRPPRVPQPPHMPLRSRRQVHGHALTRGKPLRGTAFARAVGERDHGVSES
jgi:hypothetical protein